ncbi:hypothetical protein M9H77_11007 [Catharanthus roseus]|uniref:Uncharacterized protein n=1 Tax=Catharanthus roseus TaxID=4058 RepID=A0ACC0BDK7_CATRO|nr:hypothetical protein M9H77_11007 [Catharanthus roseus]
MRKFLPENGRIARTSDRSHFELPGPATGLGTRSPGPTTGLGKRSPGPASHLFCHCQFWLFGPALTADKIGWVEGRAVTASSHGVRRHPSTSDIPFAPALFAPGIYYNLGAPGLWHPSQWTHLTTVLTGATDCGNPSSDAGWGRNFGTSKDGNRIRSEEPVMAGFLRIEGGEDDEDDGGDDDDDDNDDHGDDDEPVPMAHASSSGYRSASGKGKWLTDSFMSVMSKIVRSRQKDPRSRVLLQTLRRRRK